MRLLLDGLHSTFSSPSLISLALALHRLPAVTLVRHKDRKKRSPTKFLSCIHNSDMYLEAWRGYVVELCRGFR